MAKSGLTPKQQIFVAEYLKDLNATQAAIRAGYSVRTAQQQGGRLLTNVLIKNALASAQSARVERLELDADWVLRRLKLISDRCVQEIPVLDHEGEPTGEYRFEAAGANRATELIAKHLGMFIDRSEVTGANGEPLQVFLNMPEPKRRE